MRPKGNGLIPLHDEKQEGRGFFCIKLVQFLNTEAEMGTEEYKRLWDERFSAAKSGSCFEDYEICSEPAERDPYPPYRERLHPRKHWQRKPYWLRTRSNPKKKGYH